MTKGTYEIFQNIWKRSRKSTRAFSKYIIGKVQLVLCRFLFFFVFVKSFWSSWSSLSTFKNRIGRITLGESQSSDWHTNILETDFSTNTPSVWGSHSQPNIIWLYSTVVQVPASLIILYRFVWCLFLCFTAHISRIGKSLLGIRVSWLRDARGWLLLGRTDSRSLCISLGTGKYADNSACPIFCGVLGPVLPPSADQSLLSSAKRQIAENSRWQIRGHKIKEIERGKKVIGNLWNHQLLLFIFIFVTFWILTKSGNRKIILFSENQPNINSQPKIKWPKCLRLK